MGMPSSKATSPDRDRQPRERGGSSRSEPRYFHLVWDHELDELQPVFEAIRANRDAVLGHWHELYVVHFGDKRALPKSEFLEIYGDDLEATVRNLQRKDIEQFATDVQRIGERLAERQVPFPEVIASMHLFEESASQVFPDNPTPHTYLAFDKLSHCRMIVLADTFFRSKSATAAARIRDLEREAIRFPREARSRFRGLVGASPLMRRLYERIDAASATRGTILVVGESGTGKELVARAIHECSQESHGPFVALNCSAIPRELIESELFGYKRGAFSGATMEYLGLFRAAEGGTLFLDEITEMSAETQAKLLRAIQEWRVRPVGSTQEVPVDVRLIASTNRDPEEAVRAGWLREDLYYRLQVNVLRVPPLRERLEDVPLLVEHFITLFNEKLNRSTPMVGIEDEALVALQSHSWPGNVRELSNAIEGVFTFGRGPTIRLSDLPFSAEEGRTPPVPRSTGSVPTYAEMERDTIRNALESTGGNKVQAAKLLGISRKKLYAKIAKYGL